MKLLRTLQLCGIALALSFSAGAAGQAHFESPALAQWYVTPDQPATVTLRLKSGSAPEQLNCNLLDYSGRKTGGVTLTRLSDSRLYQGVIQLSRGFHELELSLSGQRFGIVALEPFSGTPDPFFRLQSDLYSQSSRTKPASTVTGSSIAPESGTSGSSTAGTGRNRKRANGIPGMTGSTGMRKRPASRCSPTSVIPPHGSAASRMRESRAGSPIRSIC